jgi:hypothetical protein
MRGWDLIAECAENDRIELADGSRKVHWLWQGESGLRICRPSMLDSTKPGTLSDWRRFEGSLAEFQRRQCGECRLQRGAWVER